MILNRSLHFELVSSFNIISIGCTEFKLYNIYSHKKVTNYNSNVHVGKINLYENPYQNKAYTLV